MDSNSEIMPKGTAYKVTSITQAMEFHRAILALSQVTCGLTGAHPSERHPILIRILGFGYWHRIEEMS